MAEKSWGREQICLDRASQIVKKESFVKMNCAVIVVSAFNLDLTLINTTQTCRDTENKSDSSNITLTAQSVEQPWKGCLITLYEKNHLEMSVFFLFDFLSLE